MKTRKFLIVLSFFTFLYSCQETELEFSCDPLINKFVMENQEELSQISVVEFSTYDISLQRAIFNSWSADKKYDVWMNKLNYLLENEQLNSKEYNHIQQLIEHIQPDYFHNQESNNEVEKFASEWIRYAEEELNWNARFIAFIVYRLYTEQAQFDAEISMLNDLQLISSANSEGPCDCNTSSDFCGDAACQNSSCSTVSSGCGWFWKESCNGDCY